jgi:hypothetical protein
VSYLKSHVAILEAIVQDPELAALIKVGDPSSPEFTATQTAAFTAQASRTREFLQGLESGPTTILDHRTLHTRLGTLPQKISELSRLKERVKHESDPIALRAGAETFAAIIETVLVFNDLLIQKNASLSAERGDIRGIVATLTDQVVSAERGLAELGECLRAKGTSPELAKLEKEKLRLEKSLVSLRSRIKSHGQTSDVVEELQTRLAHIHKQYRLVRRAIDNLPRPEDYSEADRIHDLESELDSSRKETALLREQVNHLQSQIANYQNADDRKSGQVDKLSVRLRGLKAKTADGARHSARQQSEIAELRALYNEASAEVDRLTQIEADLNGEVKQAKRENQALHGENSDLKTLLERSTDEVKRKAEDNAVLMRRLCRSDGKGSGDKSSEIRALKEKLHAALQLIDRLQREIGEYRNRVGPYSRNPPPRPSDGRFGDCETGSISIDDSTPSFAKPGLEALDMAINQLEWTIQRSRKECGLSPTYRRRG